LSNGGPGEVGRHGIVRDQADEIGDDEDVVEESLAGTGTEIEGEEDELGYVGSVSVSGCDGGSERGTVSYNGETKYGGHGKQPVGAIGRQELVARGRVDGQGVVAREQNRHGGCPSAFVSATVRGQELKCWSWGAGCESGISKPGYIVK
jgi:hypothetical protein